MPHGHCCVAALIQELLSKTEITLADTQDIKEVNFTLGINLNRALFYKLNSRQPHFPIIKSASKISSWPKNSDN